MKFEITKEELEAIENYKNQEYDTVNQLLCDNVEILLLQKNKREYTEEAIVKDFDIIKKIYETMVKNLYNQLEEKKDWQLFKGCNVVEIDKLRNTPNIAPFLFFTTNKENAQNEMSNNESRAVLLQLKGDFQIPYMRIRRRYHFSTIYESSKLG